MNAAILAEPGRIVLDDKPIPDLRPLDTLIRVATTPICGTDVHILEGAYPVARGLMVGHAPVGIIEPGSCGPRWSVAETSHWPENLGADRRAADAAP